jgi:1-deoxy-D-xylulose-5-phosphate reductoisomerase
MNITVLGSTGSIGVNTLYVVRQHGDRFGIHALVAGRNLDVLCSQISEFRPKMAVVADDATLNALSVRLSDLALPKSAWPELAAGAKARVVAATAPEVGFVMSAIVGVAGLEATYAAIREKKRIGLANKEVLVASGRLVMQAVRESEPS